MAARVHHPRITGEDFEALLANNGWSFEAELIDGEAVVIPPDGIEAASAQIELLIALRQWQQRTQDSGLVLQSVFVKISPTSRLGPDLAWWPQRPDPRPRGQMTIVPEWVAEVLSPATRANDLGPKRDAYLAAGVRELWLVDPADSSVVVVDAHGRERVAGMRAESRVLHWFSVDVAALFD